MNIPDIPWLKTIIEFLHGYGIDLFSLLLGIIIVVPLLLLFRRRGKKQASSPQHQSAAVPKNPRRGVRVMKPGADEEEIVEVEIEEPEPAEAEDRSIIAAPRIVPAASPLQVHELRLQITLVAPGEATASVETDLKPHGTPSKQDQWTERPER